MIPELKPRTTAATRFRRLREMPQQESDAYFQDHIDLLAKLAEQKDENIRRLGDFKRLCGKRFPQDA